MPLVPLAAAQLDGDPAHELLVSLTRRRTVGDCLSRRAFAVEYVMLPCRGGGRP